MITGGKRQENPFSLSDTSFSPYHDTNSAGPISECASSSAFSFGERLKASRQLHFTKVYAVVSLILIVFGASIVYSSLRVSSIPVSEQTPISFPISMKSNQWSGYVVMSNLLMRESQVTIVTGSWTIPLVQPTENDAYSSIWVGVGGYGEKSLIQTGTAQQSVKGIVEYYAWYELLPNHPVRIRNFTVSHGDEITASVKLVEPRRNIWNIQIRDHTKDASYSMNVIYNSSRLSAEWVVEAPSLSGEVTPLADFESVTFSGCFATIANQTGAIDSFPGYQIMMFDTQDVKLVDVSYLNAEGSSFTVDYSKTVVNESS